MNYHLGPYLWMLERHIDEIMAGIASRRDDSGTFAYDYDDFNDFDTVRLLFLPAVSKQYKSIPDKPCNLLQGFHETERSY